VSQLGRKKRHHKIHMGGRGRGENLAIKRKKGRNWGESAGLKRANRRSYKRRLGGTVKGMGTPRGSREEGGKRRGRGSNCGVMRKKQDEGKIVQKKDNVKK